MTCRIAPEPSLPRRIVAAPLYAIFCLFAAVDRALPGWVPPTPVWAERFPWWCWTTADKIAPRRASRVFDYVLERCAVDPQFAKKFEG